MSDRTEGFYSTTIQQLRHEGWLQEHDQILVVAGSPVDRDVLIGTGLRKVTITNLDERMDVLEYEPYEWAFQDAEQLGFDDDSFDVCIVHQGLHHCHSPHRALLEMYRVARRGVVVFEPLDNALTRVGVRLGICQEFECSAVAANNMQYGGVANTSVPNFIYRWTAVELRKTLAANDPIGHPQVRCFYALGLPQRMCIGRIRPIATRLVHLVNRLFPRFANAAAFVVDKPNRVARLHPWLTQSQDGPTACRGWFAERFDGVPESVE